MAGAMKGVVGHVIMIETGDILEFDELGARRVGEAPVGRICIDSGSNSDVVEEVIIRDRRHLSEDGFVMPILAINKLTGKLEGTPEIVMRGFAGPTTTALWRKPRQRAPNPGALDHGRSGRLRHDQGKNPGGPEALHQPQYPAAAAHHSGHRRNLT